MEISGMMKRLLLTLVLLPLMAAADTWTDESTGYTWYYKVSDGKAEIRNSYLCAVLPEPSGSLEIPSQINGYPVVSIGDEAFEDCSGLTSVTIPLSVTIPGRSGRLWALNKFRKGRVWREGAAQSVRKEGEGL